MNCAEPEATGSRHGVFQIVRLLFVCFLAALLLWTDGNVLSWEDQRGSFQDEKVQWTTDEHTLPTLLSVVDETTGVYINALNNPLYRDLEEADFENDQISGNFDGVLLPQLTLGSNSNPIVRIREPLTLQWTLGMDKQGQVIVHDQDVLVLLCSDGAEGDNPKILDAATIGQARATHRKHGGLSDDNTTWYFPSFPVLRRDVCSFHLYRRKELRGTAEKRTYVLLAGPAVLHFQDAQTTPTAIHMAFGSRIDRMILQFKTGAGGIPVVQYGRSRNSLDQLAEGTSHTYAAKDMCEAPATQEEVGKFIPPGMLHVVTLTNLEPDTTYWYRVAIRPLQTEAGFRPTVWSDEFSFVSAPVVQADAEPFQFLVYGDQGCPARGWDNGGAWTAAMAVRELDGKLPLRAVHHFGDLSYAVGVAHIWDEWLNMISSFTPRVPLMVGVGNHEYDHMNGGVGKDPSGVDTPDGFHPSWGNFRNDSGGECGIPTARHFQMPNSTGSNGVFWWSHDLANVHTIMLSSEHDLSPGSIQHQWLKQDLAAVDRYTTPWIVLELHRPLYEAEVSPWDYLVGVARRVELEDLLLAHQVDVVLAGHYHSYLRTCQGLYKSKCKNGGPVHITVGSAGAHLDKNPLFPNGWTAKFIQGVYGYGRITVANATAMKFEFVQAGSKDDPNSGRILDSVWLNKESKVSTVHGPKPAIHKLGKVDLLRSNKK